MSLPDSMVADQIALDQQYSKSIINFEGTMDIVVRYWCAIFLSGSKLETLELKCLRQFPSQVL